MRHPQLRNNFDFAILLPKVLKKRPKIELNIFLLTYKCPINVVTLYTQIQFGEIRLKADVSII